MDNINNDGDDDGDDGDWTGELTEFCIGSLMDAPPIRSSSRHLRRLSRSWCAENACPLRRWAFRVSLDCWKMLLDQFPDGARSLIRERRLERCLRQKSPAQRTPEWALQRQLSITGSMNLYRYTICRTSSIAV
jgi:hypothetical protein